MSSAEEDVVCPFCGSEPVWEEEQPTITSAGEELELIAAGCSNPLCEPDIMWAPIPRSEWEKAQ